MKPDWRIDLSIYIAGCIVERTGHNPHEESTFRRLMGGNVHWVSPQSARTALDHSSHLGWAEIRHPYHPLRGQRFRVLKERRVSGVDTLILRELERGSFSVPCEWTDWASPSPYLSLGQSPQRLEADSLLELVALLDQLTYVSLNKKD